VIDFETARDIVTRALEVIVLAAGHAMGAAGDSDEDEDEGAGGEAEDWEGVYREGVGEGEGGVVEGDPGST
jgi:hypothetical protein